MIFYNAKVQKILEKYSRLLSDSVYSMVVTYKMR